MQAIINNNLFLRNFVIGGWKNYPNRHANYFLTKQNYIGEFKIQSKHYYHVIYEPLDDLKTYFHEIEIVNLKAFFVFVNLYIKFMKKDLNIKDLNVILDYIHKINPILYTYFKACFQNKLLKTNLYFLFGDSYIELKKGIQLESIKNDFNSTLSSDSYTAYPGILNVAMKKIKNLEGRLLLDIMPTLDKLDKLNLLKKDLLYNYFIQNENNTIITTCFKNPLFGLLFKNQLTGSMLIKYGDVDEEKLKTISLDKKEVIKLLSFLKTEVPSIYSGIDEYHKRCSNNIYTMFQIIDFKYTEHTDYYRYIFDSKQQFEYIKKFNISINNINSIQCIDQYFQYKEKTDNFIFMCSFCTSTDKNPILRNFLETCDKALDYDLTSFKQLISQVNTTCPYFFKFFNKKHITSINITDCISKLLLKFIICKDPTSFRNFTNVLSSYTIMSNKNGIKKILKVTNSIKVFLKCFTSEQNIRLSSYQSLEIIYPTLTGNTYNCVYCLDTMNRNTYFKLCDQCDLYIHKVCIINYIKHTNDLECVFCKKN